MRRFSAITGLVSLFILPGCSLFSPTLNETGVVDVEIIRRESPPRISHVSVYRSSDKIVIRGLVKYPDWTWFKTFLGHMDITVKPPEGEIITMHDVAVVPKRLPKKRGREAFFVARVGADTPKGTRITVEYSDEKHEKPM